MSGLTHFDPGMFVLWYVVFLFSLTFHEGAHALVAYLGGDDTAYHGGQVTLNPLPHVRQEPFGTILLPILSYFFFGWMMGWASTPYDPYWAQRHPRRAALMALAGPTANLLLAVAAFIGLRLLLSAGLFVQPQSAGFDGLVAVSSGAGELAAPLGAALSMLLVLNALLAVFNVLPVPPLDGSGVLQGLLPPRAADRYRAWLAAPGTRTIGLLLVFFGFGRIVDPLFSLLLRLVYPGTSWSG